MSSKEIAPAKIKRWRENPPQFVYENFNVTPDKWQLMCLEHFGRQDLPKLRISLQACVGPGKSAVLAWCGWNFMSCYGQVGHHPKGAAVSVTSDNLKDNLWPEFSKWQTRSGYLNGAFTWTKERIFAKHHPQTWFLSARSWSKTADPEEQGRTLSGLHSKYVLVLIDESGEIPVPVLKAAEQTMADVECSHIRIMQAGNPTSLDGMLYAAATTLRHLWHVIRITGDPDDPDRSPRIDIEWAREQIKTYGRENPWVMSSILGMFPPASINSLLGVEEVQAAMRRHLRLEAYEFAQKRIGVDAARFGDDPWVLFPRQGLAAFAPVQMRNPRSHEVAARIAVAIDKWGKTGTKDIITLFDDTGGWAAGAEDALLQGGHSYIPVSYNGKASDPRYINKRSQIWFLMAEWVQRGGALPYDEELVGELTVPTYTFIGGKFALEEKDQVKKRLGRSPNKGDALANTFALPDMPAKDFGQINLLPYTQKTQTLPHDFDPYAD